MEMLRNLQSSNVLRDDEFWRSNLLVCGRDALFNVKLIFHINKIDVKVNLNVSLCFQISKYPGKIKIQTAICPMVFRVSGFCFYTRF